MRLGIQIRKWVLARAILVSAVVVLVAPFAWTGGKKKAAATVDLSTLVWPSPPDEARILFLGQYTGELDLLGKKQARAGVLERLAGVNLTPDERPRMIKPYGVAVDSAGRVMVADTPQHTVFVFNLDNKSLSFLGDKAPANLESPVGVAVDEKDRVFVSDSKLHQVTCFAPDGSVVAVFGGKDLKRPAGLAVDNPLRRIYVADVEGRRIAVFDLDTFKLLQYFAEIKSKDEDRAGALTNPNSIAVDPDGLIYITDAIVPRVFVYDTDGKFVRVWGKRGDGPGMFGRPKGIAIDADGHVYVADAQLNRMQVFSSDGTPLLEVGGSGVGPGQFLLMAGLACDVVRNRLIAVDQLPARIEVFRYITDDQVEAAKKNKKGRVTASGPGSAQPLSAAKPDQATGPTIEQLQKELKELKAKLAAQEQQQKQNGGANGTAPPEKPSKELPKPPR